MDVTASAVPGLTDPEYLERSAAQADQEVRRRSVVRIPLYPALFLAILGVTPFLHRYPRLFISFGALIGAVCLARLAYFSAGVYLTGALWGTFCALTVTYFELGWTSFFVMLVTCGIAAGEMSALSPRLGMLWKYLALMLLPTALACLGLVGGLKGVALGVFFAGFLLFLLLQGRVQYVEYWARLRENARLSAMIDALPGTVAWVSSELKYFGVNRRMAELWKRQPSEFVGQRMGFADSKSPLAAFADSLFKSTDSYRAMEVSRDILGEARSYYLFGQKYNFGTEAILLGLDMTERKETEDALLAERAQRLYTARLANLGQAFARFCEAMEEPAERIHADIRTAPPEEIQRSVDKLRNVLGTLRKISSPAAQPKSENFRVSDVIGGAAGALGDYAVKRGVAFEVTDRSGAALVRGDFGQLLEVCLSLVNNSLDALEGAERKKITLCAVPVGQEIEISVSDSGKGIPPELAEKIFEPLFSTKEAHASTGVGLSISKEIVEEHGGSIFLDPASSSTRFVIRLPLVAISKEP